MGGESNGIHLLGVAPAIRLKTHASMQSISAYLIQLSVN